MLTFGSLFTGIGGFDLGFEHAGMRCTWQIEIDEQCQETLVQHWPDVLRYDDVRKVSFRYGKGWKRYKHPGPVDVVCGGFPCQDLSVAGKRAGLAGDRSGLWFEFARIIKELGPRWVVIENVPGLLSSGEMGILLGQLAKLGYMGSYRVLDAQFFGVAQRRRRVFIVGHLGDGRGVKVLFERARGAWDTAPSRKAGANVARRITGGAAGDRQTMIVGKTLTGYHGRQSADETMVFQCHGSNVGPMGTLRSGNGHVGGGVPFVVDPLTNSSHIAEVYPTLRGQPNQGPGRMADDAARAGLVRRLTPRECERLQGFPDDWTVMHSDSARYRMLGNAVAVPVAEWIGKRIVMVDAS